MSGELQGALAGVRVVELSDERCAWAGKLLADMGAEVVKVEPPGGDPVRGYEPFFEDVPGIERSLAHWYDNTSKLGVTLDTLTGRGRELLGRLISNADIVLESNRTVPDRANGALRRENVTYEEYKDANPRLIWVSITPFGRSGPRADEPATDLTLFAGSGPGWMNGYDDHSLPPVRGGGGQAYHTGGHYAVMSALVALLERDVSGEGQFIDVNISAAANVTTEAGSYTWLVSQQTVQRQTGRHAAVAMSMPSQVVCADGRMVNTGVPPRRPAEFGRMYDWLVEANIVDEFPLAPLLEMGGQRASIDLGSISTDADVAAIFGAGRECVNFIASKLGAYEFFTGAQARGFQVGIIYSPEETMEDPHFKERGFPVQVDHPELGRTFTYPGAPYRLTKSPWRIRRRAPLLGEDNATVFGALGVSATELAELQAAGVI
ncbi:hypothetical protein AYO38_00215 [bacterium SCGC AG-212-C10]|nr:hypothetical protein AYO38_00215 [bacterium SCGC AG-212-C10]